MAISPRSRGLGNIGNIVNRQGRVSPTRPAPMPVPRLAPAPMAAPSRPNTTTFAQRQASQPFRNFTKPAMPKVDPMAMQPQMPMTPRTDIPPGAMMRLPVERSMPPMPMTPPPTPFNPQPRTDIPPGAMMRLPVERSMTPPPQPFNPQPNPGQMPPGAFMGKPVEYAGQMFGGGFGNYNQPAGQQMMPMNQQDPNQMFGAPTVDANGPAGMQPGQMFGNPNPLTSDYDELEGSAFNTNPSMGGSMFSGGGFSGY